MIIENEIKEHLKNITPKLDESLADSYLKEINILKPNWIKKKFSSKNWLKQYESQQ